MTLMTDTTASTMWRTRSSLRNTIWRGAVFCIGKNTAGEIAEYTPKRTEKDQYIKEDAIQKVREEYPKFALESHTFDMHNRVKGKEACALLHL